MTSLQRLERNTNAVRFPGVASLSQDASLMKETYAQHGGCETLSTTQEQSAENNPLIHAYELSTAFNVIDIPDFTFAQNSALPPA